MNVLMRKLLPMILLFAAPLLSNAQTDTTTVAKTGAMAPDFEFKRSKTEKVHLSDYKGKLVLLDFWATWCPPCREELPRVEKEIWQKYKDNPKFALFAFAREEGWEKVLPFKEKNNYTFLMLPDENRNIYKLYATQFIPRNVLIDEDGKIIYQSMGYSDKDFKELLDVIAQKLK